MKKSKYAKHIKISKETLNAIEQLKKFEGSDEPLGGFENWANSIGNTDKALI